MRTSQSIFPVIGFVWGGSTCCTTANLALGLSCRDPGASSPTTLSSAGGAMLLLGLVSGALLDELVSAVLRTRFTERAASPSPTSLSAGADRFPTARPSADTLVADRGSPFALLSSQCVHVCEPLECSLLSIFISVYTGAHKSARHRGVQNKSAPHAWDRFCMTRTCADQTCTHDNNDLHTRGTSGFAQVL